LENPSWNVMKISILAIAATLALAYGCAHSGTTSRAAQWPSAVIPQYNVDSVTRDSAANQMYALVGTVVDSASGRPIATASVDLRQPGTHDRRTYSDDRGGFVLGRVVPGRYQLLVRRIGYMAFIQDRYARAGVVDTVRARLPVSNMTLQ
jgi:hypothetical protein